MSDPVQEPAASLHRIDEVNLHAHVDEALGLIVLDISGLGQTTDRAVLADPVALQLSCQLFHACARQQRNGAEPAGPLSSTF